MEKNVFLAIDSVLDLLENLDRWPTSRAPHLQPINSINNRLRLLGKKSTSTCWLVCKLWWTKWTRRGLMMWSEWATILGGDKLNHIPKGGELQQVCMKWSSQNLWLDGISPRTRSLYVPINHGNECFNTPDWPIVIWLWVSYLGNVLCTNNTNKRWTTVAHNLCRQNMIYTS